MTKYVRTKEDWVEIGEATKKAFYELNHVYTLLQIHLGESNKEVKKVGKACTLISQARCNLEDQMFRENPYLNNYWLNCFYGPEMDFDPNGEEAKRYEPDPLGFDGGLKEEKK